jgi:hypothetical protein
MKVIHKILIGYYLLRMRSCVLVVKSFWLQIQRSRVRFPALQDFLTNRGYGAGSTQLREDKLRSYLNGKVAAPVYKSEINGRGNSLR